jgi:hypothetical protein
MIKPRELESDNRRDIWAAITAAETGDTETLRLCFSAIQV